MALGLLTRCIVTTIVYINTFAQGKVQVVSAKSVYKQHCDELTNICILVSKHTSFHLIITQPKILNPVALKTSLELAIMSILVCFSFNRSECVFLPMLNTGTYKIISIYRLALARLTLWALALI